MRAATPRAKGSICRRRFPAYVLATAALSSLRAFFSTTPSPATLEIKQSPLGGRRPERAGSFRCSAPSAAPSQGGEPA